MSIRRNIKLGLLGLSAVALLVGGFSACNENNDPALQDVYAINVQLSRFALGIKNDKSVTVIPFSINNSSPQGIIENMEPLPYGMKLDKVLIMLTPAAIASKVEIALGDAAAFETWSATKEYQIPDATTSLRVRLSLDGSRNDKYEYIYKVNLRKYKFDPETIEWTKLNPQGAPRLSEGYTYTLTRPSDVLVMQGTASENKFYTYRQGVFSPIQLFGLPSGEQIVQATSHDNTVYVYTSASKVYRLLGSSWQEIQIGAKVRSLLGVLPPRLQSMEPRLALIIEEEGREVFASYSDGKLSTRGQAVPEAFPRSGGYTFGMTKTYVGGALTLIGEQTVAGVPTQSTWYTTDLAEDWLEVAREVRPDRKGAHPAAILMVEGQLYRLESLDGLRVYTSTDRGKTWKKNGSKALPTEASTLSGAHLLGYLDVDNTIQLLGDVDMGGGAVQLLRGRPKNHDL